MTSTDRMARVAPFVTAAALVAPVLLSAYPPMTDLPLHEELVTVLRHRTDPAWFPPGLYETNLAQPNVLFVAVGYALSFVLGIETAMRVTVAVAVAAMVLGASRAAAHLGTPRWTALLVAPIALGWTFLWGLGPNLVGLAALLLAVPDLDRVAVSPTSKRVIAASAWMPLLCVAHESAMVFGALVVTVCALLNAVPWRTRARAMVPVAVAIVLALAHDLRVRHTLGDTQLRTWFKPFSARIVDLPRVIAGAADAESTFLAVLFAGALLVVAAPRALAAWATGERPSRERLFGARIELVALAGVILYLVAPTNTGDITMLHQRFLPYAAVLLAVAAPRRDRAPSKIEMLLYVVVPFATLFCRLPSFADSARAARDVDSLAVHVQPNSSIGYIHIGPDDPTRPFSVTTISTRIVAQRGGRSLTSFANIPHSPVVFTPSARRWALFRRVGDDPLALVPEHDLRLLRYVFVHTNDPRLIMPIAAALAPEARLVDGHGEWFLFESNLPTLPLTAGDDVPIAPGSTRLADRIARVFGARTPPTPE